MVNEKMLIDKTIDYVKYRTLCEVSEDVRGRWNKKKVTLKGSCILMEDSGTDKVLGSEIPRSKISAVTFVDTLEQMPQDAWDVSKEKDASVWTWIVENAQNELHLYIGTNGGVKSENCKELFKGYSKVKTICFNNCFHTENVADMSGMFDGCSDLEKLDMSGSDTRNVVNMSYMFRFCSNLVTLNLAGLNTHNVTDMRGMFECCFKLSDLDVSKFDTHNVTDMVDMFYYCKNLTELNVSGFDTCKVECMTSMFAFCENLSKLDVSGFDTHNVKFMSHMFSGCKNLSKLDLSRFDTSRVSDMSRMFQNCENLQNVDISGFSTRNVNYISMENMFTGCTNLTQLEVGKFDITKIQKPTKSWDEYLGLSEFKAKKMKLLQEEYDSMTKALKEKLRGLNSELKTFGIALWGQKAKRKKELEESIEEVQAEITYWEVKLKQAQKSILSFKGCELL